MAIKDKNRNWYGNVGSGKFFQNKGSGKFERCLYD